MSWKRDILCRLGFHTGEWDKIQTTSWTIQRGPNGTKSKWVEFWQKRYCTNCNACQKRVVEKTEESIDPPWSENYNK